MANGSKLKRVPFETLALSNTTALNGDIPEKSAFVSKGKEFVDKKLTL